MLAGVFADHCEPEALVTVRCCGPATEYRDGFGERVPLNADAGTIPGGAPSAE